MPNGSIAIDLQDVGQTARIFKLASNPARLRVLLALAPGETDTGRLPEILRELDPGTVSGQLQILYTEGLAKRRKIGRHDAYTLSRAGAGIVRAYAVILEHLGRVQIALADMAPATDVGRAPAQLVPPAGTSKFVKAATLLNHAGNPLRLRLLLALTDGGRDSDQLASELGGLVQSTVSHHLSILRSGTLVASHHSGRQHIHVLTMNGLTLVQVVRATCSGLSIRKGELTLWPGPVRKGHEDALDPTSPDGLACMLKTFAHPVRLRILNLLVGSAEVCSCHLPAALQLPRSPIFDSLEVLRRTGLVIGRRVGNVVFLTPAQSAGNLLRSLIGCFGLHLAEAGTFETDRQRLQSLPPCKGLCPSGPAETTTISSDESRVRPKSRTA